MMGIRVLGFVAIMIFLGVNEFTVMMILPILGIPDGPLKYLIDAALLVALSSPFLYVWARGMATPLPERGEHDSDANQVLPLDELERQVLIKTLEMTHGDRTAAAQLLGIGRSTVYRKVKKFGLDAAAKV